MKVWWFTYFFQFFLIGSKNINDFSFDSNIFFLLSISGFYSLVFFEKLKSIEMWSKDLVYLFFLKICKSVYKEIDLF
jgi:hypothetical protein